MRILRTLYAVGWALFALGLESYEWWQCRRDRRRRQTTLHPGRRATDAEYQDAIDYADDMAGHRPGSEVV